MTTTSLTDYQSRVIAKFWRRMAGIYETRWTGKYGTTPTPDSEWISLLTKLSTVEIQRGLQVCQNLKKYWPPIVLEFKDFCLDISPLALGLPNTDQAFHQALAGNYKNAVVKRAAEETGVFYLNRGVPTDLNLKKRFEQNYLEMVKRWAKGESLYKTVTKALEHGQESPSFGVCDDLIEKEIRKLGSTGKSHYEQFKALKIKRG